MAAIGRFPQFQHPFIVFDRSGRGVEKGRYIRYCMSLVIAVEPDDNQARLLRGLVGGSGTELVLVMSAHAAVELINKRVPDLILLSDALGSKNKPVFERLKSIPPGKVRTLGIPSS